MRVLMMYSMQGRNHSRKILENSQYFFRYFFVHSYDLWWIFVNSWQFLQIFVIFFKFYNFLRLRFTKIHENQQEFTAIQNFSDIRFPLDSMLLCTIRERVFLSPKNWSLWSLKRFQSESDFFGSTHMRSLKNWRFQLKLHSCSYT